MTGGWSHYVEAYRKRCALYRERVLAHPDLAARLCDPPMSLSSPQMFTGYVPPPMWRGEANNSRHARQVIAVLREVAERDQENGLDPMPNPNHEL